MFQVTRYFDDNGKALNINEAKIDFHYDDSDNEYLVIEIMTFKHMETSWIDLDVQPTYLRYNFQNSIFYYLLDQRLGQKKMIWLI